MLLPILIWKIKKLVAREIRNDKQFIEKDKRLKLWISFNGSSICYNTPKSSKEVLRIISSYFY